MCVVVVGSMRLYARVVCFALAAVCASLRRSLARFTCVLKARSQCERQ